MQNYELFWNNQSPTIQPVLDYDTFITSFTAHIKSQTSLSLNPTQKQYIRSKIDPQNRNEIYKNGFLLFCKHYWDIPSNRTNLLKMNVGLETNNLNLMSGQQGQKLVVEVSYQAWEGGARRLKYEVRDGWLYLIDYEGDAVSDCKLREKGFLSLGASQDNDICILDNPYVNPQHMKLITLHSSTTTPGNPYDLKPTPITTKTTTHYLRNTSKSNPLKYTLNNPHKHVIVKPSMLISIGLSDEYILEIDKIQGQLPTTKIPQEKVKSLIQLLNACRLNYLGEIDSAVPEKTVFNVQFGEVSLKEVEEMFSNQMYYPLEEGVLPNKSDDQDVPKISFTLTNTKTLAEQSFSTYKSPFTIGRSQSCTFNHNTPSLRPLELTFAYIGKTWLLRNPNQSKPTSLQINTPSVYLTSKLKLQSLQHSNRIKIYPGYPYVLSSQNLEVSIEVVEPKKEEQY